MDTPASASVVMICPNLKCRKVLRVPANCRGNQVKCQFCGLTFRVPQHKGEATPPKQ